LSDYSVCTTWHVKGKDYYLIDVLRERLIYPLLKRKVIDHARQHNAASIVIEDKGSGTSLIQDLRLGGTADVRTRQELIGRPPASAFIKSMRPRFTLGLGAARAIADRADRHTRPSRAAESRR
jgi:terminase large subunit-like protein